MRIRSCMTAALIAAAAMLAAPLASADAQPPDISFIEAPPATPTAYVAISSALAAQLDVLALYAQPNWETCILGDRAGDTVRVVAQTRSSRQCAEQSFGHAIATPRSGPCVPTVQEAQAFEASGELVRVLVCGVRSYGIMAKRDWLFAPRVNLARTTRT